MYLFPVHLCLIQKLSWMNSVKECFSIAHLQRQQEINKSLWFDVGEFHGLAEWMVYFFQCEIKAAYVHKNLQTHTFYQYIKKFYDTDDKIHKLLETTIAKNFSCGQPSDPNYKNSINFLLTRCKDRLAETHDKHEYLIEYNWYLDGKSNETSQVFNKVSQIIYEDFNEWKTNRVLYELLEEEQLQKTAKKNKKKKNKKNKKEEEQNNPKSDKEDEREKLNEVQILRKQIQAQIEQNQIKEFKESQQQQKKEEIIANNEGILKKEGQKGQNKQKKGKRKYIEKYSDQKILQQKKESQIQDQTNKEKKHELTSQLSESNSYIASQISSLDNESKKKVSEGHTNRKIIRNRINEYYQQFVDHLSQQANNYDRYRKMVFKVVQHFLQTVVLGQKIEWNLNLYGSSAAGFALKQSDIDLVVHVDQKYITLEQIKNALHMQLWAIDTKLIPAQQIPLITFKVSLTQSPFANQLQPKQRKKLENISFSVDLTLSQIGKPHSGITNTNQLKELFEKNPPLRTICLLYKQFLRVNSLNKPYKGGISSYVLVILIYSVLSRYKLLNNQKPDYSTQIKQISRFMSSQFKPFKTIICCSKETSTKVDPTLHLNIEDPESKKLLKTSAFQIDRIIAEMQRFGDFQEEMEKNLQQIPANETKNMKRIFLQRLEDLMFEEEKDEEK